MNIMPYSVSPDIFMPLRIEQDCLSVKLSKANRPHKRKKRKK